MENIRTMLRDSQHGALLCFSHLRWDFVLQRPQHLLSRCASSRPVLFFEEPIFDGARPMLQLTHPMPNLVVATPHLPKGLEPKVVNAALSALLTDLLARHRVKKYDAWYYTPMALAFTESLRPRVTIYDCMDELSNFHGAPKELRDYEARLFSRADLVFTGGQSLYEAKRHSHPRVHCFPSSIDVAHFSKARLEGYRCPDQDHLPRPRIGFFGVIDERLDIDLLDAVAARRPDWHFMIIGPVVKIDQRLLPRRANIHYLGKKGYEDLPEYLAGWDVAMLPFAHNAATRFISPTKTPEYLAGGRPVVSTSIRDVVRPYGELGLVSIADTPEDFVEAIRFELDRRNDKNWRRQVESLLASTSWDKTWREMEALIESVGERETDAAQARYSKPAPATRSISSPLTTVRT